MPKSISHYTILRAAFEELPNSFSESFVAEARTLERDQFEMLYDVVVKAHDTLRSEDHFAANPRTYKACAHEVSRGAF